MKYKKIWVDYFEGGNVIWSEHNYEYHSYMIINHILSELPMSKNGKIIQLGTGLGLSIVNKIINDHGGEIKFYPINDGAKIEINFKKNGNRNFNS